MPVALNMWNNTKMIILIILDTLRSDHLGCYGYHLPTSPNIDRFAKDSVLYRYAFSNGSYTVPVHASILTGKLPSNHSLGFHQGSGHLNPDRDITLAEILRSIGYRTAAIVSSYVLRKETGLNTGFDIYDDQMTAHEANRLEELIRDGKETNKAFFKLIKSGTSEKSFYFIHYFDIHGPYIKGFDKNWFVVEQYGDVPKFLEKIPDGFTGGIPEYQLLRGKKDGRGNFIDYEKDVRYYLAQYDKGIRYCDEAIGNLFEFLKEKKLYDDSMIILTSDHGEALGENNIYFFHGLTVSLDQIKIPLIIKFPRSFQTGEVGDFPVSHIDIMPTILNFIDIDIDRFQLDGQSLIRSREENSIRWILSENQWQRAIIRGEYILLSAKEVTYSPNCYYYTPPNSLLNKRLYNYVKDLGCSNNLIGTITEDKDFLEFDAFLGKYIDPKEEMITEKNKQLANCYRKLARAQVLSNSVLNSWSWKMTKPLRYIYRTLLRHK